ncbi:MAG: SIS domain-containing protein [Planctomycetota bacterium]|nr:SIS domain-containing protein [Planctomycetota bacterium]
MGFDQNHIRERIHGAARTVASLEEQASTILEIATLIRDRLRAGRRVFTAGNGGSAAEAMHLAEEMIGRYRATRAPMAAVCLNADPTALTCIANDFGFDEVFARQVEGLAQREDVLVVFSTSGASENIARGLAKARSRGVTTVGLLGKGGGRCLDLCDAALVVKSDDTAHIQEAHQAALHIILEALEADE